MITPDIVRLSPNVNASPMPSTARTVVIHATRSGVSMNPSEFEGTLNYMSRPGTTSSHWVIARDGRTARVVHDVYQAWHGQEDNDNAWGIELEQGDEADGFTPAQLDSLVRVCCGYIEDFGVAAVHATASTQAGFIGHQETAQGRRNGKSDPGRLFPWEWFINALQGDDMSEAEKQELEERRNAAQLAQVILDRDRYRVVSLGTNGLGQPVYDVVLSDGSHPNPQVIIAG